MRSNCIINMEIALLTDVGLKRSNNQDYVNRYTNRAGIDLIVLADGMGGHRGLILNYQH